MNGFEFPPLHCPYTNVSGNAFQRYMDKRTLNSTNKTIYIILFLLFIFVGLLVFFLGNFDNNTSDMCSFHKDLFEAELDSAVVIRHFVDKPNHAMKTVLIRQNETEYTIYFIPWDNAADFEKLRLGDVVTKGKETFEMKANNNWTFRLKYDCEF
jgi:hypothetical protein